MSCPVHIWVPLMAAAVPFTRTVRDRFAAATHRLFQRDAPAPQHPRQAQRWAPIAPTAESVQEPPGPR